MVPPGIYCTSCGAANQAHDTFCFACGQPLRASTPSLHSPLVGSGISTLTGLLTPNHLLKQRYCILKQIGKGGMGAVYRAEDTLFHNRLVAVKEMSQSGLNQQEVAETMDAFKREAHMLANLDHQNLPKIYDYFNDTGRWYLVMDFIAGETLEDYLNKKGGKFPIQEVLDIAMQLCTVLDYLHTRQPPIIFRDLKPSNVIRTATGEIYLIDFGIARLVKHGHTKDTVAYGSIGYAAPEQFGKLTTPQSDIYSLGALLHQMLSGHDPSTNTPDPFTFPPLPKVSTELERLIGQMVQMNAINRPVSMATVKQELQRIASPAPQQRQIFQRPRSRGVVPVGKRLPLILFAVLLVLTIPVGIIVSLVNTSHGMSTVHTTSAPTKPPVSSTTAAEPTATSTTVAEPTATLTPPSLPISMDTFSLNDPNSGVHWGRNQEWIFDPIYIPKTGSYHLTLKYEHNTNTTCDITVDGGEKQKVNLPEAVPFAGSNPYPGNVTIIVKLNKGNNDITVYPPPDLQYWNELWLNSITISQ